MDDLIYRDTVIKIFRECRGADDFTTGYNLAVDEYRKKIAEIPSVNRMIPCNERLPEKDKDVLLRQSNGDYVVGYLCSDDVFDTDCGFMGLDKITHWMPLPDSIS